MSSSTENGQLLRRLWVEAAGSDCTYVSFFFIECIAKGMAMPVALALGTLAAAGAAAAVGWLWLLMILPH